MRILLDRLYHVSLWLAALCLVAIGLMVGVQLAARLIDGAMKLIGLAPYGLVVLSLAEIAGNLLCGASFLALAATLKAGAHIRVTMLLSAFSEARRRYFEMWAFGSSAVLAAYITWSIGRFAYFSWRFDEVSNGVIPVPLALPQAIMALGAAVLTIALIDEFVIVTRGGRPTFRAAEEAITLGKEG